MFLTVHFFRKFICIVTLQVESSESYKLVYSLKFNARLVQSQFYRKEIFLAST